MPSARYSEMRIDSSASAEGVVVGTVHPREPQRSKLSDDWTYLFAMVSASVRRVRGCRHRGKWDRDIKSVGVYHLRVGKRVQFA